MECWYSKSVSITPERYVDFIHVGISPRIVSSFFVTMAGNVFEVHRIEWVQVFW